jgi:hypothetical protein
MVSSRAIYIQIYIQNLRESQGVLPTGSQGILEAQQKTEAFLPRFFIP